MQGSQRSIRRCVYRPSAAAAPITYLPEQLKGYGIWKVKEYRSGLVTVADTVRQRRFMEILVLGKATLLLSSDDNNDPHFFLQRSERPSPEELRLITRTQKLNGILYKQEIKQYQQTLLVAFADYPTLAPRIKQARFVVQDLVTLFERYNTAVGSKVQVNAMAKAKTSFRIGLVAGLPIYGKMKLKSTTRAGYYNATMTSSRSPVFGLQVAINNPRLSRRLWLQISALYQHRNYTGTSLRDQTVTSLLDDHYDLKFEATFVHVPIVVRFEPLKGRFRPVVEVGLSSNFRLNQLRNDFTTYYTVPQTPVQRELLSNPRGYEQGFLAGVSLTTALANGHHANVTLRYELTNGFTNGAGLTTVCSTVFGLVSYDLVSK